MEPIPVSTGDHAWDVDFSLALHNRTGKFHIGRDILAHCAPLLGDVYYWRLVRDAPPEGLLAKVIGRAEAIEHNYLALLPRRAGRRRRLHLDPLTVLTTGIGPDDAVVCHDLGPLTHPDLFPPRVPRLYERAYRMIAERGPCVVFVSRASERAFGEMFGRPARSRVIYPPIRIGIRESAAGEIDGGGGPFFLTVGSVGRRKNQIAAMRAFVESGLAASGWSYVVCGTREPGSEEALDFAAGHDGINVLPYVSDAELARLYRNARAFVLVSRLEGFGMPVAEAMSYGLVPIITRDSVLEEVAGPRAIAVACDDVSGIAAALRTVAEMPPNTRAAIGEDVKRRALGFTEERFIREWRDFLTSESPRRARERKQGSSPLGVSSSPCRQPSG